MKQIPTWLAVTSHFAVPAIFAFLAYLEVYSSFEVRWETVAIFTLISSPFLLILLSLYVKKVKWGNKELETQSTSSTKDYVKEIEGTPTTAPTNPQFRSELTLISYNAVSDSGKKILRTLWHFQKQHFGIDSDKRWGFTIGSGSEYRDFEFGAFTLMQQNAVVKDQRGMVFLTDSGLEFCKKHRNLVEGGTIWSKFDN